jgi:hypothetical protein
VVELGRGAYQLLVELMRRLDLGDLAPCAGDCLAHVDQFGEHVAWRRRPCMRLEHRLLDPGDRFEQQVGLGAAIAPRNQRPRGLARNNDSSAA